MTEILSNARVLAKTVETLVQIAGDDLLLRVEVFQCLQPSGHYLARIWRLDHFRVQSTFPQSHGVPLHSPSDEVILKEFEGFESPLAEPTAFADAEGATQYVLERLTAWVASQRR